MKERKDYIEKFPEGQKWLNCLPSKHTKEQYAQYLKLYCDSVKKNPTELIQLKIQGLKLTGETGEFQAEDLLESFFAKCKLKPSAKLSLRNAVFSFYKWNRRALEKTTASNVKNIPIAKARNPTLEDIQTLEDNVSTQRDKAIIRFLASTALRIGSLAKINWNDMKPTNKAEVPFMLEIEATRLKGSGVGKYRGIKQICFVNKWVIEKLETYKKEAQLKGYTITEKSPIFISYYQKDHENTKPLKSKGYFELFDNASLRAWHDLEEKKFSPHDLRSFLQSALESASINVNMISPFLGHKVKGVDANYSQHTIKELMDAYISALPFIIPKTTSLLEKELNQKEEQFKTQQQEINKLKETIELLYPKKIERHILTDQGEKTYTEEFSSPEQYVASEKQFRARLKDNQSNAEKLKKSKRS